MSTTSTAPAFKAALLASLQADSALAGVQVQATYPGDTLRAQAIYFGKTTAKLTTPVMASSARIKRQEEYVVEIHIDVASGVANVADAEDAAFVIMGSLDNALAVNPLQGQTGANTFVWRSYVSDWVCRPYYDDDRQGWAVMLSVSVSVSARLT